jgi:hypothetical protein
MKNRKVKLVRGVGTSGWGEGERMYVVYMYENRAMKLVEIEIVLRREEGR